MKINNQEQEDKYIQKKTTTNETLYDFTTAIVKFIKQLAANYYEMGVRITRMREKKRRRRWEEREKEKQIV